MLWPAVYNHEAKNAVGAAAPAGFGRSSFNHDGALVQKQLARLPAKLQRRAFEHGIYTAKYLRFKHHG